MVAGRSSYHQHSISAQHFLMFLTKWQVDEKNWQDSDDWTATKTNRTLKHWFTSPWWRVISTSSTIVTSTPSRRPWMVLAIVLGMGLVVFSVAWFSVSVDRRSASVPRVISRRRGDASWPRSRIRVCRRSGLVDGFHHCRSVKQDYPWLGVSGLSGVLRRPEVNVSDALVRLQNNPDTGSKSSLKAI